MPPYLRLGSIPRKRHIAHPQRPGLQGRGDLLRGSRHGSPASRGPIAWSITCGRRRASSRHRAGRDRCRSSSATSPRCGIITSRRGRSPAPATRSPAGVPLLANDDVILAPLPARRSRRTSCSATPTPTRCVFVHSRPGRAAHDVRPAAVPRLRLRRHPALHDLSARIRAGLRSPTCSSSRRPATCRSRRGISIPTARSAWALPTASATSTARARSASIDREQETTVLIKDGRRLTRYTLAQPPVRRRRLGRDGLSLHLQRRRLRADHRDRSTSRRRSSRPSTRRGSWSARSPRGCSTPTPRRSRCRMPIRTCRPTRCCITSGAGSAAVAVSRSRRSRSIRAASRTGRTPARSSPAATSTRTDELAVMVDTVPAAPADAAGHASWTTRPIP